MAHGVVFLLPRAGMGPPWLCAQFHSHSIERVCVGFHAICAIPARLDALDATPCRAAVKLSAESLQAGGLSRGALGVVGHAPAPC